MQAGLSVKEQLPRASTRDLILDAAEREFAAHSYDGVPMRRIAVAAGVALGAITYHFPTKEALFEAVLSRRSGELNRLREAAFAALSSPTLEELLEAFFGPFLERIESGEQHWHDYARNIGHASLDLRWNGTVSRLFGNAARNFIARVREVEPRVNAEDGARAHAHMVSIMVGFLSASNTLNWLADGRIDRQNLRDNYRPMIRFIAGGIRSISQRPS